MNDITYVGLDVHKATVCVAIAESGRGGEVREVGIDLSPLSHPPMSRVLVSFEPCWLGGATGRGAEPST